MRFLKRKPTKSRPTNSSKVIACLDLQARQIQATIIERKTDKLSIIGFAQVAPTSDLRLETDEINQTALENYCFLALKTAKADLNLDLSNFVLGVSSDFIRGVTHKIQLRRAYPQTPFNQKELDQLIIRNQAEAIKIAEAENQAESPKHNFQMRLLNSSLIGFALDGKPHLQPLGQTANFAGIQLYNVFVPDFWQPLAQKLGEKLNLELIALAYKPFALIRGFLGNVFKPDLEALLIEVEQQMTHVMLIRNGALIRTKHFALGSQIFDKALSRNLNIDPLTTAHLSDHLGEYNFSQLSKQQQIEARKILNHTTAVWLQALTLVLKDFKVNVLPARIYLTGQVVNLKGIIRSLQQPTLLKILPFKEKLQVEILGLDRMSQIEARIPLINQVSMTALAGLACLAVDVLKITEQTKGGFKS